MSTTLDNLRKSAKRWLKALRTGDSAALERLRRAYPAAPANPVLRDVQHALARELGCESWQALKARDGQPPAATGLGALLAAAARGDAAEVAAILDREPALLDQRGLLPGHIGLRTALHFGVAHASVVRELLARGADPNVRDEGDDAYPLHFAAGEGFLDVVRLLVEHGADPVGAGNWHAPLDVVGWSVCFEGSYHPEVARYLLDQGARLTLLPAVALGEVAAIARLAAEGEDLDQRMDPVNQRRTPLHLAIAKGQPASLAALLEQGADPDLEDAAGLTPLDQAALAGDEPMTERLIAAGAAIRLPAAVLLGRDADLERLVEADPDLLQDPRLWTRLLVRASRQASGDRVERLLLIARRQRAGLSIVNMEEDPETAPDGAKGYTALHAAAAAGNLEAAAVLLRHGANPRVRDSKYCGTPGGWARHFGRQATADLLIEADVDIFDAIDADRGDVVARILDRDPEAIDRPFKAYASCAASDHDWWPQPDSTPLQWAERHGQESARQVLAERAAAARTAGEIARAGRIAAFLGAACWDGDLRGRRDHRLQDRAAQRLLAREPELAEADLFTAIVCGNLGAVEHFLEAQPEAVLERGGARGWTPLLTLCYTRFTHPATHRNALAIAKLLLDRGANPNDFYLAGDAAYTALVGVAAEGEQDAPRQPYAAQLFDLLLERGAEPFDIQVLYNTHFSGDLLWWLELVHRHTAGTPRGAVWNDPDWPMFDMGAYGCGARFLLEIALKKRDLRLAQWLLERGANPNAAPARDWRFPKQSLYGEALAQGFTAMAELLLRHGAAPVKPELTEKERLVSAGLRLDRGELQSLYEQKPALRRLPEPLLAAAEQNRPDAAALLLDLGVSPDVSNFTNERPLHRAAMHGALAVAQLLLERGAEVDARESRFGATPLGWSSFFDRREMVELLGRVSRDFRSLCFSGSVARVGELLAEKPALAATPDRDGTTPLFWLPDDEDQALAIAEALLAAGADPAAKDPQGQTPAEAARRRSLTLLANRLELG